MHKSMPFPAPTTQNYLKATGEIRYNMTNDYMFRAVLQENREALCGLICAVLRMKRSNIRSIEVLNPIKLGERIDDKSFQLDIRVLLNDNTYLDVEMQVENYYSKRQRSFGVCCAGFWPRKRQIPYKIRAHPPEAI